MDRESSAVVKPPPGSPPSPQNEMPLPTPGRQHAARHGALWAAAPPPLPALPCRPRHRDGAKSSAPVRVAAQVGRSHRRVDPACRTAQLTHLRRLTIRRLPLLLAADRSGHLPLRPLRGAGLRARAHARDRLPGRGFRRPLSYSTRPRRAPRRRNCTPAWWDLRGRRGRGGRGDRRRFGSRAPFLALDGLNRPGRDGSEFLTRRGRCRLRPRRKRRLERRRRPNGSRSEVPRPGDGLMRQGGVGDFHAAARDEHGQGEERGTTGDHDRHAPADHHDQDDGTAHGHRDE